MVPNIGKTLFLALMDETNFKSLKLLERGRLLKKEVTMVSGLKKLAADPEKKPSFKERQSLYEVIFGSSKSS